MLAQSVDLKGETIVIKLSAGIINDDTQLANFSENVYLLTMLGINVIIIHDYSQILDSTLQLLGFSEELKYKNNITSYRTTQIIEMVLVGHINSKIVSSLCNVDVWQWVFQVKVLILSKHENQELFIQIKIENLNQ
ncbi:amino acid kinase family protein [Candidatus Orientia mediorientalis]|uniref:hypothetical protein n=1 Tax=Candidatus Orientia mediorientalis TaxID=911112 RepID=UPI001E2A87B8|nr:hypothetical protein [Candidatus Orientia mediorientalis]